MKRLHPTLCVATALMALAGCEPGFLYVIPGTPTIQSNGQRSVVDVGNGVEARFHANVFVKTGTVDVQVINRSEDRIEFRITPAEISYGHGKPVHDKRCADVRVTNRSGDSFPLAEPISIPRGMTVELRCQFVVDEFDGGRYGRDYRTLHIDFPGFSRNGTSLKIAATMESSE